MTKALAVTLLVCGLGLAIAAHAQSGFEPAPVFKAADLAPAALLSGPRFKVDEQVTIPALQPRYIVRSDFGVFEANGRDQLASRVKEIGALEELEKTSKTEEFLKAAGSAARRPVKSAANMIMSPVETVQGIPAAASRFWDRASMGAKAVSKSAEGAGTTDEKAAAVTNRVGGITADVFGYEEERRALAKRLNVDPYTSNHVLSEKLNEIAWVSFSGRFGLNTVVAVVVPFSTVLSATSITDNLVWDMKPADLMTLNAKKLKEMGVGDAQAAALRDNKFYSLSVLTSMINSLESLAGAQGRDQVVTFAAATATSEERARLLAGVLLMLQRYHASVAPIAQLSAPGPIVARTKSGATIIPAPVDYVAWTEPIAKFAARPDLKAQDRTLWLTGALSPRAKQEFQAAGWTVKEGS